MRIKLDKPKNFFDELLEANEGISLVKFSKIAKINYSNLKYYARGQRTIPDNVFKRLLDYSLNNEYWIKHLIIVGDNWGNKKGGTASAIKRDNQKVMAHARSFRKITEVNINLNKAFCEFYGALLGDGCISRYTCADKTERWGIWLVGNLKLDYKYIIYLKELLLKEYNLHSYYYERKNNCCALVIKNKQFCLDLNELFDVPIGVKYNTLKISRKILNLPWNTKKYVLRGLFDTDGIIFARKDENYKYPHVSITSKSNSFLKQIMEMLREQGYPAYINGIDVRIKGIKNVLRWFEDIGSSNPRNLNKYEYFLKHGYVPNQSVIGPVG